MEFNNDGIRGSRNGNWGVDAHIYADMATQKRVIGSSHQFKAHTERLFLFFLLSSQYSVAHIEYFEDTTVRLARPRTRRLKQMGDILGEIMKELCSLVKFDGEFSSIQVSTSCANAST